MVVVVDLAVEFDGLVVHAGFAVRFGGVAGPRPRQAGLGVHIHQERQVGLQSAASDAVQVVHGLYAEAPPAALVGHRGIRETVAQHDLSTVERRQDPLVDILRARGEIQQDFGGRAEFLVGGIEQDPANLHGDGRAAGFRGLQDSAPVVAQARRQAVHLGSLAGAIHALESDEPTALFHVKHHCSGCQGRGVGVNGWGWGRSGSAWGISPNCGDSEL